MSPDLDPRAAHALHILSNVRGLLDRIERALGIPGVHRMADLDAPLRALSASQHTLAVAWNRNLAGIPEQAPPEPPAVPERLPIVATGTPKADGWDTSVHPLAQRMLAE